MPEETEITIAEGSLAKAMLGWLLRRDAGAVDATQANHAIRELVGA